MTTFQPIILKCPLCNQKMHHYELTSYTVFHSTIYSDSKTITNSFADNNSAIRICASCNKAFWVDDAVIETDNPYALVDNVPKAMDILDLPFNMSEHVIENMIKFYENLLKQGFAYSNEKKYYLRIRLWWAINDLIRYRMPGLKMFKELVHFHVFWNYLKNHYKQRQVFKNFNMLFSENLLQLISLTDIKSDEDYILMAEMHRELGRFKKARAIINEASNLSNSIEKKMKTKIFFRRKHVFKF